MTTTSSTAGNDAPSSSPALVDWDGPDDPDNPQNWTPAVKAFHGYCIAGVAFVGTFGSSVQSPAIHQAANDLSTSTELSTLAYAIYILGLALGAPIATPLSETIGRRTVFWCSTPIFAAFALGTGFSNNIAALVLQRFFSGLFASGTLSLGAVSMADIWSAEDRSLPMTVYVGATFLAPAIAPLVGAATTQYLSWRWASWMILFVGILTFFVAAPFMRETYKTVILARRARLRGVRGPSILGEGTTKTDTLQFFLRRALARPLHMYFTEPVVTSFVTYVAFNFALLYAFFAAFNTVFEQYYGFDLIQIGLTFLGIGVGVICGALTVVVSDQCHYKQKLHRLRDQSAQLGKSTSIVPPEHRLPFAMLGGPLMTAGLFLFGWTAAYRVHWIAPVIGEALFGWGNLLVFMSATQYVMDVYGPLYGGSAQGANTLMRYLLGFAFPLFAVQMFENLGVQWACTLLGCLSAVGMCIPFVLYHWGPRLRERTRYPIGN